MAYILFVHLNECDMSSMDYFIHKLSWNVYDVDQTLCYIGYWYFYARVLTSY